MPMQRLSRPQERVLRYIAGELRRQVSETDRIFASDYSRGSTPKAVVDALDRHGLVEIVETVIGGRLVRLTDHGQREMRRIAHLGW